MILGIDYHDTITYHPEFFKNLIESWNDKIYILSGTPESKRQEILTGLKKLEITGYDELLLAFEYKKENMTADHFTKMKKYKLEKIREYNIQIYFDDNPIYVNYLRNEGILVFQPVLSDKYIDEFSKRDKYFTCHFQRNQFKNISIE
ncbi:hypothetical protein OAK19_03080 [Aureispira]|nr:hypothetical protein [Aureispira sp.]